MTQCEKSWGVEPGNEAMRPAGKNKTDISYLKISRVFFYTNHSIEGCVQQQISLSLMQL